MARDRGDAGAVVGPLTATPAHGAPGGAGYTLLLLAHVASGVVGFGALCVTGLQAARARAGPGGARAAAVRRYFRPGVNWPARALYLVPVFGFALLATSRGAFDVADAFVVSGLVTWSAAAAIAELVLWPAERHIQHAVAERWEARAAETGVDEGFRRTCTRAVLAAWLLGALFVAAVVLMVAKP